MTSSNSASIKLCTIDFQSPCMYSLRLSWEIASTNFVRYSFTLQWPEHKVKLAYLIKIYLFCLFISRFDVGFRQRTTTKEYFGKSWVSIYLTVNLMRAIISRDFFLFIFILDPHFTHKLVEGLNTLELSWLLLYGTPRIRGRKLNYPERA